MGFKLGANIRQSLMKTRCKFRAPPTSGTGEASARITRGRKSAVLYLTSSVQRFGQELGWTLQRWICLLEGQICL